MDRNYRLGVIVEMADGKHMHIDGITHGELLTDCVPTSVRLRHKSGRVIEIEGAVDVRPASEADLQRSHA